MPLRRTAIHGALAAAIVTAYLAPVLLPGLSGLLHEGFHAVHGPLVAHSSGEDHSHVHPDGGAAHSHAELVDALLLARVTTEDALEDAHVPASDSSGPGVHLPEAYQRLAQLFPISSTPRAAMSSSTQGIPDCPPTPPPRA
ncbi:MAG: hypothetical protein V3T20_07915 [Gemmatimonadota bacterium]